MHTLTAETTADRDGVDLGNLDAGEQDLDSLGDLDLGSIGSDLEGVLLVSDTGHGVLGNRLGAAWGRARHPLPLHHVLPHAHLAIPDNVRDSR